MHELFAQVLSQKDLSSAGNLFDIEGQEIEKDLSLVLHKIREISESSDYVHSINDQSVVEICVIRVTTAIRETDSIERHIGALLVLLESCLRHNLCPRVKDENPPHAKIASDILNCIFRNHLKKSVIEMALPVAVRFLTKGNKMVCNSLSSFLSLAAMNNPKILAKHLPLMLDSIIVYRNHHLVRVLPNVYSENPQAVLSHIADLIHMVPECEPPERSCIVQLCCLVARDRPQALEQCIPQLCHFLSSTSTSASVLQAFVDLAAFNAAAFVNFVGKLKQTASAQPNTLSLVANILGAVGRINKVLSKECITFFVSQLSVADSHVQATLLREIKGICDNFPNILPEFIDRISSLCQMSSSTSVQHLVQLLRELASKRGNDPDRRNIGSQTDGIVTVITIGNGQTLNQTSSEHVAILSGNVLGGFKSQKNASTSTQDMDASSCSHSVPSSLCAVMAHGGSGQHGHQVSAFGQNQGRPSAGQQVSATTTPVSSAVQLTPTSGRISDKLARPGCLTLDSHAMQSGSTTTLPNRSTLPGVRVAQSHHIPSSLISAAKQAIPQTDAIQQFCEKHLEKIKLYMNSVSVKMPIPVAASLQDSNGHKMNCVLNFACATQSDNCLYNSTCFSFRTKNARTWIHLIFLAIQERSQRPITAQDSAVTNLRSTWDAIKVDSNYSFVKLVTSNFPSAKDQTLAMNELTAVQYFDLFEFRVVESQWSCFLCGHPEKVLGLIQDDGLPLFEGQLKEKKGRLKVLKPWKSRYFTLSGATITYNKKDSQQAISNIQTVKVIRKGGRGMPTAFEVFANDKTYVFKAKDAENIAQWVQCLQIAIARTQHQNQDNASDTNVPRWASLGRPVQNSANSTQHRHGRQVRI